MCRSNRKGYHDFLDLVSTKDKFSANCFEKCCFTKVLKWPSWGHFGFSGAAFCHQSNLWKESTDCWSNLLLLWIRSAWAGYSVPFLIDVTNVTDCHNVLRFSWNPVLNSQNLVRLWSRWDVVSEIKTDVSVDHLCSTYEKTHWPPTNVCFYFVKTLSSFKIPVLKL